MIKIIKKIKEKIKQGCDWIKAKGKKILISLGIIGVVVAAGVSLQPDKIPFIEVEGQKIEFPYTDETSNEDLIIRTDKEIYANQVGQNLVVYMMVENKSGKGQITNIQFYFPREDIKVNNVKTIKPNSEYELLVEEFETITSLNATSSKEISEKIKTGEHIEKRIGNVWEGIELENYDKEENDIWIKKGKLSEKSKPNQKANKKVQKVIFDDGISYFKLIIDTPPTTFNKEEFYIEVIGDSGGYGHLDPTVTQTALTNGVQGSGSSATTASISPSANKLVLVAINQTNGAGSGSVTSITGAGMTWVEVASTTVPAASPTRTSSVWRSLSASPGSGALTINFSQTEENSSWIISEFGNVDTSGTNGSGAVVQSATDRAESGSSLTVTLGAFGSADNATFGHFYVGGNISTNNMTAGTGFTEIVDRSSFNNGDATERHATEWRTDNDTSVDMSANGTPSRWTGIAIEIKYQAPPSSRVIIIE